MFVVCLGMYASTVGAADFPSSTTTPLAVDLDFNSKKISNIGDVITKGPWVDVRAYGADGTDGLDDTTAIQNAINAIPSSGGTVFFPAGAYTLNSSALNLTNRAYVRLIGTGMRSTKLIFGSSTHGLDLAGADHAEVKDMWIINAGAPSAKAGLLLSRTTVGAGGNNRFERIRIEGWEVGIYSYGSEHNSYSHVDTMGKVGYFINAANPLNYTSSFTTVTTGGQSNTYGSWFHGWIFSSGQLSATYDAALVIDDAISWQFYNPIISSRAFRQGNNVILKNAPNQIGFHGVHFENVGAVCILIDGGGTNNLSLINATYAGGITATEKVIAKSAAGGSVSQLTVLNSYSNSNATLIDLDIAVGVLASVSAMKVNVTTRFGGMLLDVLNPSDLTLPSGYETQGIAIQSQGRVWNLGTTRLGGPAGTTLGPLTGVRSISGATDYQEGKNLRGQETLPAGTGSKVVTFPTAEPNASYYIQLNGDGNQTLWATNKTATSFTINRSSTTGIRIVDWLLVR